jgi:hypothetical protein
MQFKAAIERGMNRAEKHESGAWRQDGEVLEEIQGASAQAACGPGGIVLVTPCTKKGASDKPR